LIRWIPTKCVVPRTDQEAKGENIVFPRWCVSRPRNGDETRCPSCGAPFAHLHDIFLAGDWGTLLFPALCSSSSSAPGFGVLGKKKQVAPKRMKAGGSTRNKRIHRFILDAAHILPVLIL
jgi:hypothetical protein